jgi:hypothetical protein
MDIDISSVKIGDFIKVKPGIFDPDTMLVSNEGWQGRRQ